MERRPRGMPLREEGTERHDVGGGRAVCEPALWGRLVERLNVTGDGEGRPYGGKREVGMDFRRCGNNGGGEVVNDGGRCRSLRGMGTVG